jgi:hypothetical protein
MTEMEKMLAGFEYDCGDAELLALWHYAKDTVNAYNNLPSANLGQKEALLLELLGGFGERPVDHAAILRRLREKHLFRQQLRSEHELHLFG